MNEGEQPMKVVVNLELHGLNAEQVSEIMLTQHASYVRAAEFDGEEGYNLHTKRLELGEAAELIDMLRVVDGQIADTKRKPKRSTSKFDVVVLPDGEQKPE